MDKKKEQKQAQIFQELLAAPDNRVCCDCGEKNPRWAVWNIGSFVCVNCAGVHRHLGVHISKVKSVTLDSWTPEQLESVQTKGNAYVNSIYDPHPERHAPCPRGEDSRVEQFLRDKYERKIFADPSLSAASPSAGRKTFTQEAPSGQNAVLHSLIKMGFKDDQKNHEALRMAGGDIDKAVAILVKQAVSEANKQPAQKVQDPIINFTGQAQIPQKLSNPNPQRSQPAPQPAVAPVQTNFTSPPQPAVHHQTQFDGPDLLGPAIVDNTKKDNILALFSNPSAQAGSPRSPFPPAGMQGRYPQQSGYPQQYPQQQYPQQQFAQQQFSQQQYTQQSGFSQPGFPGQPGQYPQQPGFPQNYPSQMRYPPQNYPQMGYPNQGPSQFARSNSLI